MLNDKVLCPGDLVDWWHENYKRGFIFIISVAVVCDVIQICFINNAGKLTMMQLAETDFYRKFHAHKKY